MGLAAGLAKKDIVYVYSTLPNFPYSQMYEQIRYDIAYHNLEIKQFQLSRFAYGSLGSSHHATEDID